MKFGAWLSLLAGVFAAQQNVDRCVRSPHIGTEPLANDETAIDVRGNRSDDGLGNFAEVVLNIKIARLDAFPTFVRCYQHVDPHNGEIRARFIFKKRESVPPADVVQAIMNMPEMDRRAAVYSGVLAAARKVEEKGFVNDLSYEDLEYADDSFTKPLFRAQMHRTMFRKVSQNRRATSVVLGRDTLQVISQGPTPAYTWVVSVLRTLVDLEYSAVTQQGLPARQSRLYPPLVFRADHSFAFPNAYDVTRPLHNTFEWEEYYNIARYHKGSVPTPLYTALLNLLRTGLPATGNFDAVADVIRPFLTRPRSPSPQSRERSSSRRRHEASNN